MELRQGAKRTLYIPSHYVPLDTIPLGVCLELMEKHPSWIYIRFMRAEREITTHISMDTPAWNHVRRLNPESLDYYTDHPHLICGGCFDALLHQGEDTKIPPGNWPRWESDQATLAKRKKKPFEFGVTIDSLFLDCLRYPLEALPPYLQAPRLSHPSPNPKE